MTRFKLLISITSMIPFLCATTVLGAEEDPSSLVAQQVEVVQYQALPSSRANHDRSAIAVRQDGLVRIVIKDFEGACCPLVAPLKVATRGTSGDWSVFTIATYGDHPVPHFLPTGELGVTYLDYSPWSDRIKFAIVGDSSFTTQDIYDVGINPGQFLRLTPWTIQANNDIQAVSPIGFRFRRLVNSGWETAEMTGTPQDVAIGTDGKVLILAQEGLLTFPNSDLNAEGTLVPVEGGVPLSGNLVVDRKGEVHIAYTSGGAVIYGRLGHSGTWKLSTVATGVGGMLNDQALVVDKRGNPYLIYENADGHIVIAGKKGSKWAEMADYGQGLYGNMVLGPDGTIHLTFTSKIDELVRYTRITPRQ